MAGIVLDVNVLVILVIQVVANLTGLPMVLQIVMLHGIHLVLTVQH